jgi:hypothetical protein
LAKSQPKIPKISLKFDAVKPELIQEAGIVEPSNLLERVAEPETEEYANRLINEQVVQQQWNVFLDQLEKDKELFLSSGLRRSKLQLVNELTLNLQLPSKTLETAFLEKKSQLLQHFNKLLNGKSFQLEIETVSETTSQIRGNTFQDRLEALVSVNPNLPVFIEKLGLEFDY